MASCGGFGMATAASRFLLTPNVTATAKTNINMAFFPSKINNNNNLRLVVRAAEDASPAEPAPATATAVPEGGEAPKPKPPFIGPKRGAKVSFHLIMTTFIANPIILLLRTSRAILSVKLNRELIENFLHRRPKHHR
ncbi:photosystem I reaction center subunit IV A, chloroplastic-like [Hibiscus syriacus]|uniref:photosystem I reaction center subunit IV A, chloroplastic-like n=1 Tax=Hibiscus syriacus TaxID=106335 RepID=UPI00192514A7|nr:photosystem I reaction center subunit IV A, chloroplastic-like [Hibiscus syriacus]